MKVQLTDCCLTVVFDAEPELVVETGDVDPLTGEEVGWPGPRVYWSNGLVTDGAFQTIEVPT